MNKKQIKQRIAKLQSTLDNSKVPNHIRKQTIVRIENLNNCLNNKHHFIKMMFITAGFDISDPVICCEYCHQKQKK